jgi:hypothetical protein
MTKNRQKCEVFSRSMGYIRPVDNFNIGKRAEYEERKTFRESVIFGHIRNLFKKKEDKMPCGKKKGGKK